MNIKDKINEIILNDSISDPDKIAEIYDYVNSKDVKSVLDFSGMITIGGGSITIDGSKQKREITPMIKKGIPQKSSLYNIIDDFIKEELIKKEREESDWEQKESARDREYDELRKRYKVFQETYLSPANNDHYNTWLTMFIKSGGLPTHYEDDKFDRWPGDKWWIAEHDFVLDFGLYGAMAIDIIVPKGIKFEIKELGHCNIYDMNNSDCYGNRVPIFSNTKIINSVLNE